jgi:hypothetical protein
MKIAAALATVAGLACVAQAQVRFNEVFVNPPSPDVDNTREFIELKSDAPSLDLSPYTIVIIEGDNTVAGVIDYVLPLAGSATGSNSLFLWRDDATLVLNPAPDAATIQKFQDFVPDIENGSSTFLIVTGFSGATVGTDLDLDNDGILGETGEPALPWTNVIDAVGYIDGDDFDDGTPSRQYASLFGGVDITDMSPGAPGFTPDAFARVCGGIVAHDILGTSPGPYVPDPLEVLHVPAGPTLDASYTLTPGSANIECAVGPVCDSIDFNGDGIFPDNQDIIDFLEVFSGGACPTGTCNDIDFNNDAIFPDNNDIVIFLVVFSGGNCE